MFVARLFMFLPLHFMLHTPSWCQPLSPPPPAPQLLGPSPACTSHLTRECGNHRCSPPHPVSCLLTGSCRAALAGLELAMQSRLLQSTCCRAHRLCCHCLPSAEKNTTGFYMGLENSNSGCQVCTANDFTCGSNVAPSFCSPRT